jgi:hypothetical protein
MDMRVWIMVLLAFSEGISEEVFRGIVRDGFSYSSPKEHEITICNLFR